MNFGKISNVCFERKDFLRVSGVQEPDHIPSAGLKDGSGKAV